MCYSCFSGIRVPRKDPPVKESKVTKDAYSVLSPHAMTEKLIELGKSVKPWSEAGSVTFVRTLQDAVRNHGRVDLMVKDGTKVAMKRMPTRWMTIGPKEFSAAYPNASERPWHDITFVQELGERGFPYACEMIGIFRDATHTYVGTGLATEGDLFGWCDRDPKPGKAREVVMLPLALQVFEGVQWLHTVGIAHRDISLENILLTELDNGELQIKIIDFGMGTLKRFCKNEVRGKQSYQGPEMHDSEPYDAFLTDTFAVGVCMYAMAVKDYPWIATKRNACQLYEYVYQFGLRKLLEKRKLRTGNGEPLMQVMSPALIDLLDGLLQLDPEKRMVLGEPCWDEHSRASIWDMQWLQMQKS